jgi:hypothetical protein
MQAHPIRHGQFNLSVVEQVARVRQVHRFLSEPLRPVSSGFGVEGTFSQTGKVLRLVKPQTSFLK